MPAIDVYGTLGSAPCRSVLMTAKCLELPVNLIETHPHTPEVERAEYAKMNPQKTIPTMNDGGLCLNESRAIMQYLCNKYDKSDTIYSKVPNERALIDTRLNFDLGTLYYRFADAYYTVAFLGQPFAKDKLAKLDEALEFLATYLAEGGYVAGGRLTIADLTVMSTLSTMEAAGHDISRLPRVKEYYAKCKKEIPGYDEICQKGADAFKAYVAPAMEKAKWTSLPA